MQDTRQPAQQHVWRQAFGFGLPLALLELGVFALFYANYDIFRPLRAMLAGLLLYVVVAALAGFWYCRHGGRHGAWAGVRAGLVGAGAFIVVLALVFTFLFLRYINTPPVFNPRKPHEWGLYDPSWYLSLLATFLALLAAINAAGVLLSALGGWLGGLIAGRWAEPLERVGGQQA